MMVEWTQLQVWVWAFTLVLGIVALVMNIVSTFIAEEELTTAGISLAVLTLIGMVYMTVAW